MVKSYKKKKVSYKKRGGDPNPAEVAGPPATVVNAAQTPPGTIQPAAAPPAAPAAPPGTPEAIELINKVANQETTKIEGEAEVMPALKGGYRKSKRRNSKKNKRRKSKRRK